MKNRKLLTLFLLCLMGAGSIATYQWLTSGLPSVAKEASLPTPTHTTPQEPATNEKTIKSQPIAVIDENARKKESYKTFIQSHPYYIGRPQTMADIKAMPKRDRPDLALEHEFLKTVDPNTHTVPSERLWQARQITQEKLRKKDKAGIVGVLWNERGPNNVGGRTRALMFDPNDATNKKVWAGSVAGGLWYNTDITSATTSWQRVDDFWSNMAISCMAYAPNATQTFYVGTGEGMAVDHPSMVRGNGIWKTTDGGNTWNVLPNTTIAATTDFRYVTKIVVNSTGVVFASTRVGSTTGGVMRSVDGGQTWTSIFSNAVADMEIAKNGDLYVGTFAGGVQRCSNPTAGLPTWTDIKPSTATGGARVEIAIAPSTGTTKANTTLYAIAGNGSDVAWFNKSTDGGSNWTTCNIPRYLNQNCTQSTTHFTRGQSWYDLILQVRPDNPDVILAGGIDVHSSTDGGTNWAAVSYWTGGCLTYVHADIHAIEFRPNSFNEVIVGSDGGVSYSASAGVGVGGGFEDRVKDYNVTQFYACAMRNEANANIYLAGAQDNGTQRFSAANIGATTEPTGGDGAFCFIDQDNPNICISSYVYNVYYRSTNGGTSFSTIANNQSTSQGLFINPADYDNDENILYSSGATDQLKRISDIEVAPTSQENISVSLGGGRATAIRADAYLTGRVFVGTSFGDIYRVDDAHTANPTSTYIGTVLGNGYVSCIDIGASDNELVVTLSNYGITSVYYTNNGGTTWVSKDETAHGLPDMPVRWALFNPNNFKQVMIATELGVWSTQDITASNPAWEPSNGGLANVRCDMLQYRTSDKQVAIATHARGLFTTNVFNTPVLTTTAFSPANNAVSVATDTDLKITFNANVVKNTGNIVIKKVSDNSIFETIDVTSDKVTITGNVVTINPFLNLSESTQYYVEVSNGAFKDASNLSFAGITNSNTWRFTTLDATAPIANTFSPANTSVNVPMSANLVITFNELVKKGTTNPANIIIRKLSDGSSAETIPITSTQVTISNAIVTINPANDLLSGTDYYVEMSPGAIQDLAGNNFAGIVGNAVWRFTIETDITAPQAITFLPANNSLNFPGANNLVMTFNENIQKGTTGSFTLRKLSDNSQIENIPITSSAITVAGKVVTINPTQDLPYDTEVYVEMTSSTIRDLAGNGTPSISGSSTWKFKTDFSTSVEDNSVGKAVSLYPNPVTKTATLEVNKGIVFQGVTLQVIDMKGATVWSRQVAQLREQQTLDLQDLPKGKYILEINTQQGKTIKSFIKQ
ncbi:MAG: T9SS C-terminal target domain-containing protein [Bacteroidetes bacterium]|nr:MAG: T9SS C-terminal target domain-containing protein [Bacteroidota bacterium]